MRNAPKAAGLRRLRPCVRISSAQLRRLSPADRQLLTRLLAEPLECVYAPSFRRTNAESALVQPLPDQRDTAAPEPQRSDDSGVDLLGPQRHKVLTADEERQLFLRFNYCRYRVMKIVRRERGKRPGIVTVREILRWARAALETREAIVGLNTSLVMAMVRRTKTLGVEPAELVSEGNLALLRCVGKFDCSRGFKFSTYACRAIMSSFSRLGIKTARYRSRFPAPFDPTFERSDYLERQRLDEADDCVNGLKVILKHNSADLSSVEQHVISARFALDHPDSQQRKGRGPTLEQVGAMLGVSKERVRQIQNRALRKLRGVIEQRVLVAS